MNIQQFKEELYKIIHYITSTEGIPYKIGFAVLMYYAPIKLYVFTVFAMLFLDTITGVWAAVVKGGRQAFKSKLLWKGLYKKLFPYFLLLTMGLFLDRQFMTVFNNETYYMCFFLSVLISLYESSSIVEKLIIINPDFIFLRRFTGLVDSIVDKQVKNIEKKFDLTGGETESNNQKIEE